VQNVAARQHTGFCELVKRVDHALHEEDDRKHLHRRDDFAIRKPSGEPPRRPGGAAADRQRADDGRCRDDQFQVDRGGQDGTHLHRLTHHNQRRQRRHGPARTPIAVRDAHHGEGCGVMPHPPGKDCRDGDRHRCQQRFIERATSAVLEKPARNGRRRNRYDQAAADRRRCAGFARPLEPRQRQSDRRPRL
jgi:hypothetical protein